MGRAFLRVSLGGVHDEVEIRGHRRTYIGALPGNIVQAVKKAGARNCVIMLDEIDKLGRGVHGHPSAAMLEVLDPKQNVSFRDNYLGVRFDLSRVVFLAIANLLDTVPGPLLDRMEVISLPGYTEEEKLQIARRYRQLEANGLTRGQAGIDDQGLRLVTNGYTREAGVRGLEREIGKIFRSVAVRTAEGSTSAVKLTTHDVCSVPRAASVRERHGHANEHPRHCDRPCVDASRGRHPVHRGDPNLWKGRSHSDWTAW